jgi:S-layer homology domain
VTHTSMFRKAECFAVFVLSSISVLAQPAPNTVVKPHPQPNLAINDIADHPNEEPAIREMVSVGIMKLPTPTQFHPDVVLTRGEFAASMQTMFKLAQPAQPVAFADVRPGSPNYAAIQAIAPYLNRQALCFGCLLSGNFNPSAAVSREEMAVILVRILGAQNRIPLPSTALVNSYLASTPDARNWKPAASPYIALAVQHGLVPMTSNNTFQPSLQVTRANAAVTLQTVYKKFLVPVVLVPQPPNNVVVTPH